MLVSAVGALSTPHVPDVPGDFAGPSFHTARWDHDVDLTGKHVVMVGAGATGVPGRPGHRRHRRLAHGPPAHARSGCSPTPATTSRWARACSGPCDTCPFYARWFRFLIFFPGCDTGLAAAKVDPEWGPQETSVSEINDFARMMFTEWIEGQVGDDAELRAKVVPDYPATGKRTLQDNGAWLRTLRRDHVELVRAGVDRLEPGAVVDSDGATHPADVLVWATGFAFDQPLTPLRITGRDGVDLREHWGHRPRAYLGVTVAGFPNFFCLYGPGTNLASGGSIILASECEVQHVMACLDTLLDAWPDGRRTIEPTAAAYEDYYARTQAEMAHDGVGLAAHRAQLLPQRARRGERPQPVAPGRLLGVDEDRRPVDYELR